MKMENSEKMYTVTIFTENQIGLLSSITSIFTRRSLDIWQLKAAPSPIEGIHYITVCTMGTEQKIDAVVKQIEKRIEVVKVYHVTTESITPSGHNYHYRLEREVEEMRKNNN